MKEKELRALISLLDDSDAEVANHVQEKLKSLGTDVIPFLENEWEGSFNPEIQRKIEELVHDLQVESMIDRIRLWRDGGGMDLLEGLWNISTYLYPDLSFEKLKVEINQMYFDIWRQFSDSFDPVEQVKFLNGIFYGNLNFGPNTKSFHSASNSMINVVLENRRGNPITLCVIYMLIGRKLGMPLYGVNLPNLFVLTYKNADVQFYINVFNRGIIFSKTDIDHYIAQLNLKPIDSFYQPCSNIEIVHRILRNLLLSYEKSGEAERIKEVERVLRCIITKSDE